MDITTKGKKLIVEKEGREIGRIRIYYIENDLHSKPYAFLEDLYVEEEFRGQGFATELLKRAIATAKEKGCYKIIGTSRYGREKVHEFYKKFGFEDYGKEFRINII